MKTSEIIKYILIALGLYVAYRYFFGQAPGASRAPGTPETPGAPGTPGASLPGTPGITPPAPNPSQSQQQQGSAWGAIQQADIESKARMNAGAAAVNTFLNNWNLIKQGKILELEKDGYNWNWAVETWRAFQTANYHPVQRGMRGALKAAMEQANIYTWYVKNTGELTYIGSSGNANLDRENFTKLTQIAPQSDVVLAAEAYKQYVQDKFDTDSTFRNAQILEYKRINNIQ